MLLLKKPVTVSERAVGVDQQEEALTGAACWCHFLLFGKFVCATFSAETCESASCILFPAAPSDSLTQVHKPTGEEEEEEGVNMAERLLGLMASLLTEKRNCPSPARCHDTTLQRAAIKKLQSQLITWSHGFIYDPVPTAVITPSCFSLTSAWWREVQVHFHP